MDDKFEFDHLKQFNEIIEESYNNLIIIEKNKVNKSESINSQFSG